MTDKLETGTVEPRALPSVATAANSTTLGELERKKRINKAIIISLSSLGTLGLMLVPMLVAPANFIVGCVAVLMFIVSVVVAFFTNALTPAELDDLLAKVAGSTNALGKAAPKPPDDASKGGAP